MRRKTLKQLADNPIIIINKTITSVEKEVNEIIKELISQRSNFYIESFNIDFDDENTPGVILKCVYLEYNWDLENQKVLDTFTTKEFDYYFAYEVFEFNQLPELIYSKIESMTLDV